MATAKRGTPGWGYTGGLFKSTPGAFLSLIGSHRNAACQIMYMVDKDVILSGTDKWTECLGSSEKL